MRDSKKKRKKSHSQNKKNDEIIFQKHKKKKQSNNDDTNNKYDNGTTLASRLKRERGTAATTPPPPAWKPPTSDKRIPQMLTPNDEPYFQSCWDQCYSGFEWESPEDIPSLIHTNFNSSFNQIQELFLYDIIQPGKSRLSRTMVTRTLVGEAGSTYKYLGLRLFSHPWSSCPSTTSNSHTNDDNEHCTKKKEMSLVDLGYSKEYSNALMTIGKLNQFLIQRTNEILKKQNKQDNKLLGSANYNLTLINRMEPSSIKNDLRNDTIYGMGKTSVSWHKDSGLQDFSSIAVYHTLQNYDNYDSTKSTTDKDHYSAKMNKKRKKRLKTGNDDVEEEPWKVALRVADSTSKTPPLVVPLPSGSLYYLLDDFNHQHEHAVLTGTNKLRYSSTHRVTKDYGNWYTIQQKCHSVLSTTTVTNIAKSKKQWNQHLRMQQQLLTELEFEWIEQWYIQGKHHANLHKFWHEPIKEMEAIYTKIETFSNDILFPTLKKLKKKSSIEKETTESIQYKLSSLINEDSYDIVIESFENRNKQRTLWNERLLDPIFATLPDDMKPFQSNIQTQNVDFKSILANLRKWRSQFVDRNNNSTTTNKHTKTKSLTKKEQKMVASNWEQMKLAMMKKK